MDKEYMTYSEAASYVGIGRASIYNYINALDIKPLRFGRDRRKYITIEDVEKMKVFKETPWKFYEKEGNHHEKP